MRNTKNFFLLILILNFITFLAARKLTRSSSARIRKSKHVVGKVSDSDSEAEAVGTGSGIKSSATGKRKPASSSASAKGKSSSVNRKYSLQFHINQLGFSHH